MESNFDFKNLFVLDMANNHQGSVEHGLEIVRQHAASIKKNNVRAAIKFQFRQLDSFVHPDHKTDSDNKHIPRFLSTRLNPDQYKVMVEEVKSQGLLAVCTPFDNESVPIIVDMGFDIIKVASCSALDWTLLETISESNLPTIISTGGLMIEDIDAIVSFCEHRAMDFALMHCVSIYPTPDEACNLRNIAMLKERYPGVTVGWSTHEDQNETAPVQMAYAFGAEMFERHVGVETNDIKLNAYSSTPTQSDLWMQAWAKAATLAGSYTRQKALPVEADAIIGLKRGVFAKKAIETGHILTGDDVYFAMPCQDGQLDSGQFAGGIITGQSFDTNQGLMLSAIQLPEPTDAHVLKRYIHRVKALLNVAHIKLGREFYVEYSHHYGIRRFGEIGCVLIDCVNREYCKKLIIQLPDQNHPYHYHKRKEETFQVLWGEMYLDIDGEERLMKPGDTAVVLPGAWHKFRTETGCVVEEISTTHFDNDSVYKDSNINKLERAERKTIVKHWGRFELEDSSNL